MSKRKRNNIDGFEAWGGYMEAKKLKLLQQFTEIETAKISDIFSGISISVNGYTDPTCEELKILMALHGGVYHHYQSANTTHIIASNLPNVKIKQLTTSVPVVNPDWITDSVKTGKLLDYKKYLLYTNRSRTQPKLDFPKTDEKHSDRIERSEIIKKKTLTAADPNFLSEFYSNSRLHLISTLGTEFKQLIADLREKKKSGTFLDRQQLIKGDKAIERVNNPVIMHIDMDCFFVSVGVRNRPELQGKPVAVTHARANQNVITRPERAVEQLLSNCTEKIASKLQNLSWNSSMSEVASCSYEARKFGIHNGMFLGSALKLCPDLHTIPYDFQDYKEVSHILYRTIIEYTLDIEAVSCDEMYVDVTRILQETGLSVGEFAQHIRQKIMTNTGCPCSTGFGGNKLQARLATKKAKPAGQFHLNSDQIDTFMRDIPLEDLPGVGYATIGKLHAMGLKNCADLQQIPISRLQTDFGQKIGENLYEQCRGIDKKSLNYNYERKSVSADVNYGIRFRTDVEALNFIESLSKEVFQRLCETRMRARSLNLKLLVRAPNAPEETAKFLGCGICDSITKTCGTGNVFDSAESIFRESKKLYEKIKVSPKELRGIGIQLTKLEKNPVKSRVLSDFLQQKTPMDRKETDLLQEKSPTIMQGKITQNEEKSPTVKIQESIDLNILNELPEELRLEIIEEYNLQLGNPIDKDHHRPTTFSHSECKTVEKTSKSVVTSKSVNLFKGLKWEEIKPMVRNWLLSTDKPLDVDTKMLGDYLKRFAIDGKIENLHSIVNFLFRNVSKTGSCSWHDAYCSIINTVQEGMIMRYGGTLHVNRSFTCLNHRFD